MTLILEPSASSTLFTTVSVVICAYTEDRWDDLVAAVASVEGQSVRAHQLIVVIDYNDALLERAKAAFGQAIVVANDDTKGLSGARNCGTRLTTGEVVAFLDDDAWADRDWLEHLVAGYADPSVLGVGGHITPAWIGGAPRAFPAEFNWVVGCTYRGMPEETAPIRNMIGANMSFRRRLFDEVGGFHSGLGRVGTLPLGCEETEFCIRASARWPEGTFLHEPRARVQHRVPAARGTFRYFRRRTYAEGLSKARVTKLAGRTQALASERTYATKTLPAGVCRGLLDIVRRRDFSGFGRALAITLGLAFTTLGYLHGSLLSARQSAND